MKNISFCVILTFLAAGFIACNKKSNTETIQTAERWQWPDSVENILMLPDSIRERMMNDTAYTMKDYLSPEQWKIYENLYKVIYHHQKAENDSTIVLTISREEFIETGIPEAYYDLILSEIKDYEDYRLKYGKDIFGDSLAIMWERTKADMRKEFPDIDK